MHEIHHYGAITEWCWSTDSSLLPKPFWTSCYLVDGLLIDSGSPGSVAELQEFLKTFPPSESVKMCILTHAHEDHAGGAKMLTEVLGVPVFASERALQVVHAGFKYPDYRQLTWGPELLPTPRVQSLTSTRLATPGGHFVFDIVPMPGHAPCQVALVEHDQQWAFVGDGVQPKYQMIFGLDSAIQEDITKIYTSLTNLAVLIPNSANFQLFIAGHGRVENGKKFVLEKIAEIEQLHTQVRELRIQGNSDRKILKAIFGGESLIGGMTRGTLSRMNLIHALLAWEY